jgi:hypothetical protein
MEIYNITSIIGRVPPWSQKMWELCCCKMGLGAPIIKLSVFC